jgi:hypothetical protein
VGQSTSHINREDILRQYAVAPRSVGGGLRAGGPIVQTDYDFTARQTKVRCEFLISDEAIESADLGHWVRHMSDKMTHEIAKEIEKARHPAQFVDTNTGEVFAEENPSRGLSASFERATEAMQKMTDSLGNAIKGNTPNLNNLDRQVEEVQRSAR